MSRITSFRDLVVWQKAMDLAEKCYRITCRFDAKDQWSLGNEIRKCCISIPSNIAEGYGRHHTREYLHHLLFAKGSDNELQTQLEIARRVGLISGDEGATMLADAEEVGRMLNGLVNGLRR